MKKYIIIAIITIILLTGCWDKRELNELGLVLAMGLDKDSKTDEIIVTCQVVRPGSLKEQSGANKSPIENVSARGNTVFEGIRNITQQFDRKSYFAHAKVLVIDEKLAEEGIMSVLDLFERTQEVRRLLWIIIAKDTTSSEILGQSHGLEDVQAVYLQNIIREKRATSEVTTINLLEFIKRASGQGINPVAGAMEIIEQKNYPSEHRVGDSTKGVKLSGTAIFRSDKLIGYIDDKDARGLNWIIGEVESGTVNVPTINKEDKWIAVEITDAGSKIEPELIDDNYVFTINIKAKGVITEHQGSTDVFDPRSFEKVEKEFEKTIEQEVQNTLNIIQKDFRSDVFGFGSAFSKKYPKEWEKIKHNWSNIFPNATCIVKVDGKIKGTGLLKKPFQPSE